MSKRALVVDDDPIILESLRDRLESLGYEVTTQDKALGTAQLFMQKRPSLVLMDINIPMIKGDKLIGILRQELREAVVIIHSSKPAEELAEMAKSSGADGFIVKTSSDAQFKTQLSEILRRKNIDLKSS